MFLSSDFLNIFEDIPESIFDNIKSLVFCNYKKFTLSTDIIEKIDNLCFDFVEENIDSKYFLILKKNNSKYRIRHLEFAIDNLKDQNFNILEKIKRIRKFLVKRN